MKQAAVAAPSLVGAATLVLLLGACSAGGQHTGAGQHSANTGTPSVAASRSAAWGVIQPSASVAPAAEQAASALAARPRASEYPTSSTDAVYSIADVGVSGSVEYVDAYSVAYVCGSGIPDDCEHFVGTPEYRIPLTTDARFILLGTGMRANRPVGFAAFRQYAAGTDGKYDGNNDLFDLALTSSHQATSLTAVYTP
jgi:surface antigen